MTCKRCTPYVGPGGVRQCVRCSAPMPVNPGEVLRDIASNLGRAMGRPVDHQAFDDLVAKLDKPVPRQPIVLPPAMYKAASADPLFADAVKRGGYVEQKPIPVPKGSVYKP